MPFFEDEKIDGIVHCDIEQHLFDAPAERYSVDEVLNAELSGGDCEIGILFTSFGYGIVIEPVGTGPVMLLCIFDSFLFSVRHFYRLIIFSVLVWHRLATNAPHVDCRAVIEYFHFGTDVGCAYVTDVRFEAPPDIAQTGYAEMLE